jgi:hypothetical protein
VWCDSEQLIPSKALSLYLVLISNATCRQIGDDDLNAQEVWTDEQPTWSLKKEIKG